MEFNDPRIKVQRVDGQLLYFPSTDGWNALRKEPILGGHQLPVPEILFRKVTEILRFPGTCCALGLYCGKLSFYELVELDGTLVRVLFESVVCEHCGFRPELSATIECFESYLGCMNESEVKQRNKKWPRLCCPHCWKSYQRRYTIWVSSAKE